MIQLIIMLAFAIFVTYFVSERHFTRATLIYVLIGLAAWLIGGASHAI